MGSTSDTISPGVRLVPVVELEPDRFSRGIRRLPDPSSSAIEGYWRSCLAEAGIVGLRPIVPGSWLVSVDQLTDRALNMLVRNRARDSVFTDDDEETRPDTVLLEDNLLAFNGGFALLIDGEVTILPRCCGDLSDIGSWEMAAACRSDGKEMVWIGHPWIQVHFDGEKLIFTGTDEEPRSGWSDSAVSPESLSQAIEEARRELAALSERLLSFVKPLAPGEFAAKFSRILAGLP